MGNRAVITTKEKRLAAYLHWNGGRDTIESLLRYCELHGYRSPSTDCYGWARLCQVIGNFFGGTLSVGIEEYKRIHDQGDNGTYIIDGWKIVGREELYDGFEEQQEYDFDEMLRAFDEHMPEGEQLVDFLNAVEIPVSDIRIGDMVWMDRYESGRQLCKVVGFGSDANKRRYVGKPYVAYLDHDGGYAWNLTGETAWIKPRQ